MVLRWTNRNTVSTGLGGSHRWSSQPFKPFSACMRVCVCVCSPGSSLIVCSGHLISQQLRPLGDRCCSPLRVQQSALKAPIHLKVCRALNLHIDGRGLITRSPRTLIKKHIFCPAALIQTKIVIIKAIIIIIRIKIWTLLVRNFTPFFCCSQCYTRFQWS